MNLWMRMVVAVGTLAVPAFLVGEALDLYTLRVAVKTLPVLALLVLVVRFGRRPYGVCIAWGLGLSALGDLLLELSDATFLPGVGAFLLAHVAYVVAFTGETRRGYRLWTLPFAAWGVLVVFGLRDGLQAVGMLIPVAVYTAVICSMLWRATACRLAETLHSGVAWTGAVLFAASDSLIAVSRFSDLTIPGVGYAIILLYWLGQGAIAASARPGAVPEANRLSSPR